MNSMVDSLRGWARRATGLGDLLPRHPEPASNEPASAGRAYRLRHWPALPAAYKTAVVYRLLSVMSSRPVNRRWMLLQSKLPESQLDALLRRLEREDALEVIDTSAFAAP